MQIPTGELGYIPHLTHCQSGSNAPLFQGETGGSPRVTRAPCALKAPAHTIPPLPPSPLPLSSVLPRPVWVLFSLVFIMIPPTPGAFSGKTLPAMARALICLG